MSKRWLVKIDGAWAVETPHDGRYLVAWNSNTRYGDLHVVSTADPAAARVFDDIRVAIEESRQISLVDPLRPDDKPNRPLSALTFHFEEVKE